jgi:hypothetical protein
MDRQPSQNLFVSVRPRIDQLPLEIRLYHIYSMLSITDLAQCRAVSRSWKTIVDATLIRAHPYQRTLALRTLLNMSSLWSSRTSMSWIGSGHGSCSNYSSARVFTQSFCAYSPYTNYGVEDLDYTEYDCVRRPIYKFSPLSLDAWEAVLYGLGTPKAFDQWFQAMSKAAKEKLNAELTFQLEKHSQAGHVSNTTRHQATKRTTLLTTARALLDEADATLFLYAVCRGIAQRPRYSTSEDIQSGLCVGLLHLSLDMYDRLRAAADQLGELNQQADTTTQTATSAGHGIAADNAKTIDTLESQLAFQLLTHRQRVYAQMLQQIAMSPRFLLRHSSFCYVYLGQLFNAFSMLPGIAAHALATLVHSLVTLPDGVMTTRKLGTLLTCLSGKEPLALSLLARHQLMSRYAALINASEIESCRADLNELRRAVNAVSNHADSETASEKDGTVLSNDAAASFSITSLLFLHNSHTKESSDDHASEVENASTFPQANSDIPSSRATDKMTGKSVFSGEQSPILLSSARPHASENMKAWTLPWSEQHRVAPKSPQNANYNEVNDYADAYDGRLDCSPRSLVEERLVWLFEHVTALSVVQPGQSAASKEAATNAHKKLSANMSELRVEMRLTPKHASAILPFITTFESFLMRYDEQAVTQDHGRGQVFAASHAFHT